MDRGVFLITLKGNLQESAIKFSLEDRYFFQQDNNPRHTSHLIQQCLLYLPYTTFIKNFTSLTGYEFYYESMKQFDHWIRKQNITSSVDLKLQEE